MIKLFGYVKPFKPHLRICEYETYRAVYCGLCKTLGKSYGITARLTLSYDFAFLGLMALALNDSDAEVCKCGCIAHPFKKSLCMVSEEGLEYTAAAASILIHHKILDDKDDRKFLGKLGPVIMLKITGKAYNKAKSSYPELAEYVSEQMKRQAKLEKENCKSIDRASEPFSNILGEIASGLSNDPDEKRILHRFGYLLGRFIYIADAFDDVEKDFKANAFNPLSRGNKAVNDLDMAEVRTKAEDSVNFTLGALADCYVQLEMKRFKPIIDNIVYMGLKNAFYDIINEKEKQEQRKENAPE